MTHVVVSVADGQVSIPNGAHIDLQPDSAGLPALVVADAFGTEVARFGSGTFGQAYVLPD